MKSFLVHLASIAVMAHMTFGCSWHHGMGAASACNHPSSLSSCCITGDADSHDESEHEDHDHDGHEHGDHDSGEQGHDELPLSDSTFDHKDQGSNQNHFCCSDDGCNVIKVVNYKFTSLDFVTQYLGGVADSAIHKASAASGFAIDPFPECMASAPKVRAHLLLGVQLI